MPNRETALMFSKRACSLSRPPAVGSIRSIAARQGDRPIGAGHLRLADGRAVTIRPIEPPDREALRSFFATLSFATARLRFHVPVRELSDEILTAFSRVDQYNHVALLAEADARAGKLRGVVAEARYIRDPSAEQAEFALVVAEGWRRAGIGTSLVNALSGWARSAGIVRLYGDALAENSAIRAFVRSLGGRESVACDADTVRLSIDLH